MAKKAEKKGLGRGLSALLADAGTGIQENIRVTQNPDLMLAIEKILPNPDQPRRDFAESDLADLAASIAEKGIIQPIIVRNNPNGTDTYQIVAGERRWRAAQKAQLHEIPALIRELSDVEVLELAIIENIQRADLNAIEEATGYRQLMDRFGHTQEQLAEALGKSRSHIANLLRLLNLPDEVLGMVRSGKLSAGHARALVPCENPNDLAKQIISKGLSVRQTEKLVKTAGSMQKPESKVVASQKDADTKALEADLGAHLGLKVNISHKEKSGNGEIMIKYKDLEELDKICSILSK